MPKHPSATPSLRRSARLQQSKLDAPLRCQQLRRDPTPAPPHSAELLPPPPLPPLHPAAAPHPPTLTCNQTQRHKWHGIILASMVLDTPRFAYLVGSRSPEAAAAITAHVAALVAAHPELPPFGKERDYVGWVVTAVSDPEKLKIHPAPKELVEAAANRKASGKYRHSERRQLNIMFFTPDYYGHLAMTIVNFHIRALPAGQAYPPPGAWVAENKLLFAIWAPYLATYPLPDRRRRRSPTILLDESKLQYIMPADLNFQIYDKDTNKLVFRMVRDFCPNAAFLDHGREVVHETVTTKKCIRLEDRGVIVQTGFTAGLRDAPEFGWARNTLSKKTDQHAANRKISSFMTGFWLLAKQAFKGEITDDFVEFYDDLNLPRLHPDWPDCEDASRGPLELPPACGEFKWEDVDLAPGCAVMVQRYARAVHLEHQGHRWALNWTTLHEGSNPQGGNFILAKYGILIRQSANCAFAWRPEEWHAMTLALFDPKNDNPHCDHSTFNQHSVVFVTSPRIGAAYREWEAENGAHEWRTLEGPLCNSGDEIYEY